MPFDLAHFELAHMLRFGLDLRRLVQPASTIEDAAEATVRHVFEQFRAPGSDEPSCALVRFYKTHRYGELPPDLKQFAGHVAGQAPTPDTPCLTLMATAGTRPEWNDRRQSRGHQAIPLLSVRMVEQAPMIAGLITQFGLDVAQIVAPMRSPVIADDGKAYNTFYVQHADGSPYIPAQEDFVRREHIASVLGFGGLLRGGELFAVILFSRRTIAPETAVRFRTIALELRSALFTAESRIPTFRAS